MGKTGTIILITWEEERRLGEHDVCPVTRRAMVNFFHFKQSVLICLGKITQIRKLILFTPLRVLFSKIK